MLVIVDLDGVLVDYGASSREAAVRAAGAYFEEVCGVVHGARLIQRRHTDAFKNAGGFEDDRDIVYAIVYTLLTSMPRMLRPRPPRSDVLRVADVRRAFAPMDIRLNALIGHSERDLSPTLIEINRRGGGIAGLERYFADGVMEHYMLHDGQIGATEADAAQTREDVIGRLFEEFYLGDAHFQKRYGIEPFVTRGEGLAHEEMLLVEMDDLKKLTTQASVTLFAAQPRSQLQQTLRRLGVSGLFPHVVYAGELDREEPRRHVLHEVLPTGFNVWMFKQLVDAASDVHAIRPSRRTLLFVSSNAHRLHVASGAGARCVGFARHRDERRRLKEAGAKAVVSKLKTLLKAL